MSSNSFSFRSKAAVMAIHLSLSLLPAQEPSQEVRFFDVQISEEEIYSYTDLKFEGDYTSFESQSGHLALGKTEAGVTIMIVLGAGNLTIEAPEEVQDKFRKAFGVYPVNTSFKSLYLRLHPKDFEAAFGEFPMTKSPDPDSLSAAQTIFDDRFLTSYHAGPKAIFPPEKTRVMDFDTEEFGLVTTEEGYWISLRRMSPYSSIYPRNYRNPKQR